MKRLMTSFILALGGVLSWWLIDMTMNWLFTEDTHTASYAMFVGMWWGLYIGMGWEETTT